MSILSVRQASKHKQSIVWAHEQERVALLACWKTWHGKALMRIPDLHRVRYGDHDVQIDMIHEEEKQAFCVRSGPLDNFAGYLL